MSISTPTRDGVEDRPAAVTTGKLLEADSQFIPGRSRSYAEDQTRSRRRNRILTFGVCVPLWALASLPLGRELADGGGAEVVLTYLAVAAASLGIALAIRGIYVLLRKRTLLSPMVFLIAGSLAIASYAVHTAGEPEPPIPGVTTVLQQTS
jgi:hypothetical protein